jgi:SulP family sulfate permease
VSLYEVNGPLFFGAAQKAMRSLDVAGSESRVLVIHLARVPVIDASGFVALENAVATALRHKKKVILAGPLPRPHKIFESAALEKKHAGLSIAKTLDAAVAIAADLAANQAPPSTQRPASMQ